MLKIQEQNVCVGFELKKSINPTILYCLCCLSNIVPCRAREGWVPGRNVTSPSPSPHMFRDRAVPRLVCTENIEERGTFEAEHRGRGASTWSSGRGFRTAQTLKTPKPGDRFKEKTWGQC